MGIASANEGVYVESDRKSLTGEAEIISMTVSLISSGIFEIPVNGKLRGPKSAFCDKSE
jgi:hypothetical protein